MRKSVERLLRNPQEALRLAQRARLDAENRFAPRSVAQRHLEVYQDLITQKRNR